jgi:polyisoprenoid-binding protein YceI
VNPASAPASPEAAPADTAQPGQASDSAAAAEPAASEGQVFAFGPDASKIEFIGSKVTGSHDGGFNEFSGKFRVADGQLADKGIDVVIQTDSLWSDNNRLTGHLKNEDFFDVAKYPTAKFASTAVEHSSDGAMITGDLTLHGVTKSITFPAQVQVSDNGVSLKSEFSLNRFDFDIKYPGKQDDLIRKEVVIKLEINASLGAAEKAAEPAAPAS